MNNMRTYRITCLQCNGQDTAIITERNKDEYIIDLDSSHEKDRNDIHIISARYRGDMQFGWECLCGNYSLLAPQESSQLGELLQGGAASAIEKITESLKTPDNNKFNMEEL